MCNGGSAYRMVFGHCSHPKLRSCQQLGAAFDQMYLNKITIHQLIGEVCGCWPHSKAACATAYEGSRLKCVLGLS